MNDKRKAVEAVAKAIARVYLHGGDPEQPAARWNGIQVEPQEFPIWQDYQDEARAAIAAYEELLLRLEQPPRRGSGE